MKVLRNFSRQHHIWALNLRLDGSNLALASHKKQLEGYSDGYYIRLVLEPHNQYGEKNVIWNTEPDRESINTIKKNKNIKKLMGTNFIVKDLYL